MSVLNRRLFNRGGRVMSSRGVGITSGLVNQPVQKFDPGGEAIKKKYNTTLDTLRSLDIVPERKPFNKFQNIAPAALDLFGSFMSGTSMQDGLGGALDIAGQSVKSASPLFAQALKNKQEYDATDPEAAIKNLALGEALKDPKSKFEFKVINDRLVKINLENNSTEVLEDFSNEDLEKFEFKVVNNRLVKVDKNSGETSVEQDFSEDSSNKAKTNPTEVVVEVKNDSGGVDKINALRTFDGKNNKFIYQTPNGEVLEDFNVIRDSGTDISAKGLINGTIKIGDSNISTSFIQKGTDIYVVDPVPGSETFGQTVLLSDLEGLTSYKIDPGKPSLSLKESEALAAATDNIETANEISKPIIDAAITDGLGAGTKENKYKLQENVLSQSGFGSGIEQRTSFLTLLQTFNVDQAFPDLYKLAEEGLQVNNVPATETNIALSKQGVLNIATQWNQQLNRAEFGLLIDAGPKVGLTKEGQGLLIAINKYDQQIKRESGELVTKLLADGMAPPKILKELLEFQEKRYGDLSDRETEIGADLMSKYDTVMNYDTIKGADFFERQEKIELNGEEVTLGELYNNDQIKFFGYADQETGLLEAPNGEIIDAGLQKNKPIYLIKFGGKTYFKTF